MNKILIFLLLLSLLVGCAATDSKDPVNSNDAAQAIQGKTWQWYKTISPTETVTVNHPERYTLLFLADGNAQVQFDCNRGGGRYKIVASNLTFGPMISTRMACPDDTLDHVYAANLQNVHAFQYDAGTGSLKLLSDGGDMHFRVKP